VLCKGRNHLYATPIEKGSLVSLEQWRDIALIWLSFLCFIGLLIPLAISFFLVKGMHSAVDRTPRLLRQVQGYSRQMRNKVEDASHQVTGPVIQVHRQSKRYSTVMDRLLRRPASRWTEREK
jgi:hypothetical protein